MKLRYNRLYLIGLLVVLELLTVRAASNKLLTIENGYDNKSITVTIYYEEEENGIRSRVFPCQAPVLLKPKAPFSCKGADAFASKARKKLYGPFIDVEIADEPAGTISHFPLEKQATYVITPKCHKKKRECTQEELARKESSCVSDVCKSVIQKK